MHQIVILIDHFTPTKTWRNVTVNGSCIVSQTSSRFVVRRHIGNVVSTAVV